MATAPTPIEERKSIAIRDARPSPGRTLAREFLSESQYGEWDEFVGRSPHGTIFHSSWWLGIVSPSFRLLAVRGDDGRIKAGIPLPNKHAAGLRLFHSPPLAPYLGPVFDFSAGESESARVEVASRYGEALATGIEGFDSLRYVAGASAPNLDGFLHAGFRVFLGYTFRFAANRSIEEITKGITRTHMQKLTKAKRLGLRIARDEGLETLLELNKLTFRRQGAEPPYSDATVSQLWKAAFARGQANLYVATRPEGDPVGALFTVHDARTTFQIVSGFNPNFMDVPGQNFVLWAGLQDALNAGRDFDFEGSELRGVEAFYRRWGAPAVPVWRIEKARTLRGLLAQAAIRYKSGKHS